MAVHHPSKHFLWVLFDYIARETTTTTMVIYRGTEKNLKAHICKKTYAQKALLYTKQEKSMKGALRNCNLKRHHCLFKPGKPQPLNMKSYFSELCTLLSRQSVVRIICYVCMLLLMAVDFTLKFSWFPNYFLSKGQQITLKNFNRAIRKLHYSTTVRMKPTF